MDTDKAVRKVLKKLGLLKKGKGTPAEEKIKRVNERRLDKKILGKKLKEIEKELKEEKKLLKNHLLGTIKEERHEDLHEHETLGDFDDEDATEITDLEFFGKGVKKGRGQSGISFQHDFVHGLLRSVPVAQAVGTFISKILHTELPSDIINKAVEFIREIEKSEDPKWIQEDVNLLKPNEKSWLELYAFRKAGYKLPQSVEAQMWRDMPREDRRRIQKEEQERATKPKEEFERNHLFMNKQTWDEATKYINKNDPNYNTIIRNLITQRTNYYNNALQNLTPELKAEYRRLGGVIPVVKQVENKQTAVNRAKLIQDAINKYSNNPTKLREELNKINQSGSGGASSMLENDERLFINRVLSLTRNEISNIHPVLLKEIQVKLRFLRHKYKSLNRPLSDRIDQFIWTINGILHNKDYKDKHKGEE